MFTEPPSRAQRDPASAVQSGNLFMITLFISFIPFPNSLSPLLLWGFLEFPSTKLLAFKSVLGSTFEERSESVSPLVVSDSLRPHGLWPVRRLCPWNSPCKDTGEFLSPGNLPNPGMEPGSPAQQADSLPSEPPGKLKFKPTDSYPVTHCTC